MSRSPFLDIGLNGHARAPHNGKHSPPVEPTEESSRRPRGVDIILAHFRRVYQPVFRRGNLLYSGSEAREVKPGEACFAADKDLVEQLMGASDAPRDQENNPKRSAVPSFFRTWAPVAWCELMKSLPHEEATSEVSEPAQDQFCTELAKAMKRTITLNFPKKDQEDHRECRPVIDWCFKFAKGPRWADVRGRDIWTCLSPDGMALRVALRVGLFGQIGLAGPLAGLTQKKFSALCELYGCGQSIKVRGGEARAVELSRAFIEDLRAAPQVEGDAGQTDGQEASPAGAREKPSS